MKRNELEGIYAVACAAKGFKPDDSQFKVWWKTLGSLDRPELEEAIMSWYMTRTDFPMPVELRRIVEDFRKAKAKQPEYHQQQQCPKCGGVVGMARPVGEEFRTWCLLCQSYRKIVPEDLELPDAAWQMICVELDTVFREWKKRGSKPSECVDPQVKRGDVLRMMGDMMQPV